MYKMTLYVKCEEMDEDKLSQYVASQVMSGPIECETIANNCREIDSNKCPVCKYPLLEVCITTRCKEYGKIQKRW